ncbi:MAG: hypothetical protein GXP32_06510 [Kiritimatiellaeota bacterium]|nr:hypothetical protein [Kiritimatiellota bacterium]
MNDPKFLEICCPQCDDVYRIPIEYCGKDAICANRTCGIMFSIPTEEEIDAAVEVVAPNVPDEEYSTDTVRIEKPKGSFGMIPQPNTKQGFDTSDFIMLSGKVTKKRKVFHM